MLDGKTLLEVQMERNKSCHWNYNKHNHKRKKEKFLDAGIQDVSTSISIVDDLIERYPDGNDGDESDKHI